MVQRNVVLGLITLGTVQAPTLAAPVPAEPPTMEEVAEATGGGAPWTPQGTPSSTTPARLYFTPTPADKVTIFQGGKPKVVHWGSLKQEDIRKLLDQTDESVTIEQIDTQAGVTSLPVSGSLKKGKYRVTYYYYRYRNQPCPGGIGAGGLAVGTGMRVVANVSTTKAGVNISEFIPLAIAVSREHVRGDLRVQSHGIASGTNSVSTYLNTPAAGLSADSIRKAVESFGVIKAVSDTPNINLSPNYLFVEAPDAKKCLAALSEQGKAAATLP